MRRATLHRATIRRAGATGGGGGAFPGYGSPTADIDIGDAQSDGVSLLVPRADHQHAFPAPGSAPPAVGTGAIGVATTPARSDHTHKGVEEIGGLTGAVDIVSPMKSISGQDIQIDNGNVKVLTDAATVTGITTDDNNSFFLSSALGRTIGAPTNTRNPDGQKITFTFHKDTNSAVHHSFDGSAYVWSSSIFTEIGNGIKKVWFDDFYDAMIQGQYMKIGWEFIDDYGFWVAVAMAGPWPETPE